MSFDAEIAKALLAEVPATDPNFKQYCSHGVWVAEDCSRCIAEFAIRATAGDHYSPAQLDNPCWCEHTNHFDDEFGPQTAHDYQAVSAGKRSHPWIGGVCDSCAAKCLAPYRHVMTGDYTAPVWAPESTLRRVEGAVYASMTPRQCRDALNAFSVRPNSAS